MLAQDLTIAPDEVDMDASSVLDPSIVDSPSTALVAEGPDPGAEVDAGVEVDAGAEEDVYVFPTSFAQRRLWLLDQMAPNNAAYNLAYGFNLSGSLEVAALEATLRRIVERHEALRTTFAALDEEPVQVVSLSTAPARLAIVDLAGLEPGAGREEVERLSQREAARPFDLARGPLLRTTLVRLGERKHAVLFTLHHIVGDAWSIEVLMREVAVLYEAAVADRSDPLPPLSIQYGDFAEWQHQSLSSAGAERQLEYWRDQLCGEIPVLELPSDFPRPAEPSFRGARRSLSLSLELSAVLEELGRRQGCTLFTLLLSAFFTLLHRYTGLRDIAVGTAASGRNRVETEELIGFFVNTLVMRADLDGDPPFERFLKRMHEVVLDAHSHQDVPFETLVEELRPDRRPGQTPFYQVMFTLQNVPEESVDLAGLEVRPADWEHRTAKADLIAFLEETSDGLVCEFEYRTDLFESATIDRMLRHFHHLLQGIAASPSALVGDLPLLGETERRRILGEWSGTEVAYPRDASLPSLFEARVDEGSEAVALCFGERHLSYGELDRRANGVGRRLRELGVGRGDLVGLCAERSPELLVGVVGILKAGAAYVPLDPTFPRERLAAMVEDMQARVLVTRRSLAETLPGCGAEKVYVEAVAASSRRPVAFSGGRDPAYVIYTSGSTGRPKGVMVPQRAVARLVLGTDYVDLSAEDRVAQASTASFDAATFEIWGALLTGGCLVGVEHELALSPEVFGDFLESRRISRLFLTTALFNQVAREAPRAFARLSTLLFGGEAVDPASVRRVLESGPPGRLLHVYGPTESTTFATWHPVSEVAPGASTIPIGGALANTRIYVVDRRLEPVPARVAGELMIGGDGLAHGYLRRPSLSAERFVPNPFGEVGGRLYRTGDLVRFTRDGAVEFEGRFDHQVKLRGFRIELGEIELAISGCAGVRESVVELRTDGPMGEKRLVGYVVAETGRAPAAPELRAGLRDRLPEYMIPSAFVFLEAFPLTPTGKIDRRALPVPDFHDEGVGLPSKAAHNPIEVMVADVWKELLGVRQLGIHDDFFEVGGHSLLATQLASRLRGLFEVDLPLADVFEHGTVAGLARRVQRALRQGCETPATEAPRPAERTDEPELSFAQQRLWFLHQLDPDNVAYNIPSATRIRGELDVAVLERTLNEIARRHEVLRTSFPNVNGRPVQRIADELRFDLTPIDLSPLPECERELRLQHLLEEEACRSFDLARGPLVRAALVRSGPQEHVISLTMHHSIGDGWSLGVMVREVGEIYGAFVRGEPSPLPELPLQYADFAIWQRRWLRGELVQAELDYWRRQLADAPALLDLPLDRERLAVPSFRGRHLPLVVGPGMADDLTRLSQESRATPFMTLLAVFKTLLMRWSGQTDLCLGTPIAGRNFQEIEGLIGFFVNTLVLRSDLSGGPCFQDLLARVRRVAVEAYAHQNLPFEKLVEDLKPERSRSHTPLFQVMFSLEDAPGEALELPGLTLEAMTPDRGTSKFDLTLRLWREGNRFEGNLEFNTDLFDATSVRRLVRSFENLLSGLVREPHRDLWEAPLLAASERHQLLVEWAGEHWIGAGDECLHHRFAIRVAERPEAVAVVERERYLTYAELDARAEHQARMLAARGVGPEVPVGVCAEPGAAALVGMMATFKAGGVYVPLDPAHPQERLERILRDAKIGLVLVREGLAAALPDTGATRLPLEGASATAPAGPGRLPASGVGADNLAYMIFTSGSTGRPKGVMIRHGAAVHLIEALSEALPGIAAGSMRIGLNAPLTFDASVKQWLHLLLGNTLYVIPESARRNPEEILACLGRQPLDLIDTTPFQLGGWLAAGLLERPGAVPRTLLVGGEAVAPELWRQLASSSFVDAYNVYGPTEATVDATICRMATVDARPHLGTALADVGTCVMDTRMGPVAIGVVGELHLAGEGLARGYLGRPAATAEKFVPDPSSPVPGRRLYKTGDLVRRSAIGHLEFAGRRDHQVKLRGLRIELGEIETVLAQHPAVRQAVVHPVTRDAAGSQLVAYLVLREEARLEPETARAFLKARLPDYMLPTAFVFLSALPQSSHGKLDRRALPAPERVRSGGSYVAPRTLVEETLANIWAEVLELDRVGVHDDFFDLGGHSLLATVAMTRIQECFQLFLPLATIFEGPTVAQLASALEESMQGEANLLPPIEPVPQEVEATLSFTQERLWLTDRIRPGSSAYNMSFAVQFNGRLEIGLLDGAMREVVRRHQALRTVFPEGEDGPRQRILPPPPTVMSVVELSALPESAREDEVRELFEREARRPFDLGREPLLRCRLLRLDAERHAGLFVLHHIVSDGWSMKILVRELQALYRAFVQGRPSPLPELPVQYADYAAWQRRWFSGERLEAHLDYWRRRLEGAEATIGLPTLTAPESSVPEGLSEAMRIPKKLHAQLRELCRSHGSTLFMVLLGAFQALLHRYSGNRDVTVGIPVAGRDRAEVRDLIGFFVNMLVIRTDLGEDPDFSTLLKRVREGVLEAFMHQDVPYQMVEQLHNRHGRQSPLFRTVFVLQSEERETLDHEELRFCAMDVDSGQAKFDLVLVMNEGPDGLQGNFTYDGRLFSAATIAQVAAHYQSLLEAVAADPRTRLLDIPLVDAFPAPSSGARPEEDLAAAGGRPFDETEEFNFAL